MGLAIHLWVSRTCLIVRPGKEGGLHAKLLALGTAGECKFEACSSTFGLGEADEGQRSLRLRREGSRIGLMNARFGGCDQFCQVVLHHTATWSA